MKKLLLVLSLMLFIYACSKDDSSDSNSIEGKNFELNPCELKNHFKLNKGIGDY